MKGYLLESKHFQQDINFKDMKEYTDNIILEFDPNNIEKFRRFLFELDTNKFNIGILAVITMDNLDTVLRSIAGFDIKLGLWIDLKEYDDYSSDIINRLKTEFKDNLIFGFKSKSIFSSNNSWCKNGDIESKNIIMLPNVYKTITTLDINTDYKTIYEENNLKPIRSNY